MYTKHCLGSTLTSKVAKSKNENRSPVPHDGIGKRAERMGIRHLVVEDPQIPKGISSIVSLAVIIRRAPFIRIVAAHGGVILAGNSFVHCAGVVVRVHVARETDTGWWRVWFLVGNLYTCHTKS